MNIKRIRLRKEYRLKVWAILLITFTSCFIFIPQPNRALMLTYFSKNCINYQQVYSKKLNDRIVDYSVRARLTGTEKSEDMNDLAERISSNQLKRVKSCRYFKTERTSFSYPYLTPNSRELLYEIGKRFREKIDSEGFRGSRFIITSMTRTLEKSEDLGKTNINVSDLSPHLYGNAFDISYARFSIRKFYITECDKWYLKEALAEVIYRLKEEKKCWATYERRQGCFHVVAR